MLKRFWLICLLIGPEAGLLSAQPADSLFSAGNAAYSAGQYGKALQFYLDVGTGSSESASLFLNLGNCWFRLQETGKARWAYEQAVRLDPWSPDIRQNRDLVAAVSPDKITVLPWYSFQMLVLDQLGAFRSVWINAGWLLLVAVCLTGWYFILTGFPMRRLKMVLVALSILAGLFTVAAGLFWFIDSSYQPGYLVVSVADIRSEPNDRSSTLFQLHQSTDVQRISSYEDWTQIQLSNGNTGWIETNKVWFIDQELMNLVAIPATKE